MFFNKNSIFFSAFYDYIIVRYIYPKGGDIMAKNPPIGDNRRQGAVCNRSQTYNPKTGQYVKRDAETGQFMDVKQDGTPFKGVRKEK